MSKFFTPTLALRLAFGLALLTYEGMTAPPFVDVSESAGPLSSGVPVPLLKARFAAMGVKNPFTLASAVEENPDFAKELVLVGYLRVQGKDYVMLTKSDGTDRMTISTQETSSSRGMLLEKILRDSSGDPAKIKAVIRKGTETATLLYRNPVSATVPPTSRPEASPASDLSSAPSLQNQVPPQDPLARPSRPTSVPPPDFQSSP